MPQRIARRSVARLLAGGALGALLPRVPAAAAVESPVRGGTLVFGLGMGDPPTYDTHSSNVLAMIELLTPHYSNLLKIDTEHYPTVIGDADDRRIVLSVDLE